MRAYEDSHVNSVSPVYWMDEFFAPELAEGSGRRGGPMASRPKRTIVSSDNHGFVGRIFDLSVVGMSFDNYEEAAKFPDAKYALDVNERTSFLTQRVESLNHIGDLLWPKAPVRIKALPISAYEFCNFILDAFLMRTVSILDCCCLLAVEVLELDLKPQQSDIERIRKASGNHLCCEKLQAISDLQLELRTERNVRFHRGEEEPFTDDDLTFKMVALFSYRGRGMTGTDRHGRKINLKKSYDLAIDHLRRKFEATVKSLRSALDDFYDVLSDEVEKRFEPKFRAKGSFGRKYRVFGEGRPSEP